MVHCLIFLMSPTHLISSVSAIQTLHNTSEVSITTVIHWPGASEELTMEIAGTVRALARNFSFANNIVPLSQDRLSSILSNIDERHLLTALRNEIGEARYDEVYYAHDVVGQLYQLLCLAYPDAKRVCFGDAFGNVYEKKVHLSYLQRPALKPTIAARVKHKILHLVRPSTLASAQATLQEENPSYDSMEFPPDKAVLILPVDQSGNFLKRVALNVCRKSIFLETIQHCIDSAQELDSYIQQLLEMYGPRDKLILLTENIAEGSFMGFDREIDMWCSIIKQHCLSDSVVFLKSHPGETLPRNEKIKERLTGVAEVVEIDARFKRYPIEVWRDLVLNSKVACMSYPVLSLKYLYNIDVIQPMDEVFIEKWFPEWTWASYKNAMILYMEPLKCLPQWDGKSVLWAGRYR